MTCDKKAIGGYFELETHSGTEYCQEAIALNSARNCLRYLIQAYQIKEMYVPAYTCPVVWEVAYAENCHLIYYEIDCNFFPCTLFPENAYILYTNYFGICSKNVTALEGQYHNLIVDNSQSFYSERRGLASFNSARKFFGVPDGAYLFTDKRLTSSLEYDTSIERFSHLLLRIEQGAKAGYLEFQKNDKSLCNAEIKQMSHLTHKILCGLDYDRAAEQRQKNFALLKDGLQNINELEIMDHVDIPMVYPFLCFKAGLREHLIAENIFVATYWNGQKDKHWGSQFQKYLLPIPIDQRYTSDDMLYMVDMIRKYIY